MGEFYQQECVKINKKTIEMIKEEFGDTPINLSIRFPKITVELTISSEPYRATCQYYSGRDEKICNLDGKACYLTSENNLKD